MLTSDFLSIAPVNSFVDVGERTTEGPGSHWKDWGSGEAEYDVLAHFFDQAELLKTGIIWHLALCFSFLFDDVLCGLLRRGLGGEDSSRNLRQLLLLLCLLFVLLASLAWGVFRTSRVLLELLLSMAMLWKRRRRIVR